MQTNSLILVAVFQSSFITTLATAGTALLSLSFVFAVTTQEFLGSCIFLFVKHPYDVADRVDIVAAGEKLQLIVEKISLLYTVFTRIDKMQIVQVPNIQLNNLWIENVTRSNAMNETIELNVSYDTSFEDLELLRLEMEKFVRAPDNARDFQPDITISVGGVGDLDKLNIKLAIKHKSNWHNDGVRATRRSKFMCALAMALRRVPIYAPGGGGEPLGGALNPSYSVAVSDEFVAAARATAGDNKEAKRMVPSKPAGGDNPEATEQSAAADLNNRSPLAEAADDWGYDKTLNSRDASAERTRLTEVEAVRRDLQLNRQSTRGRRKAGDTLSSVALDDNSTSSNNAQSGAGVTRYGSRNDGSYDVESQRPFGGPTSSAPTYSYGVFPPPTTGYSPPGSSSAAYAAQQPPLPTVPVTGSSAAPSGRQRSGTTSRTQQQGQGQGRPSQF